MKNKAARHLGKTSTGFTIVELLIVVVVIAILAAITIVAYNGITNRANEAAAQSAVSSAQKKIAAWRVLNGDAYPTSLEQVGLTGDSAKNLQFTGTGSGFCVTAVQNNRAAYVGTNYEVNGNPAINQTNPAVGSCPGHSSTSGSGPIIRNLATNPSFEVDSSGWGSSGATGTRSTGVWADSGTYSMRVTNSGTTNSGDYRISSSASTMPFGMEAGKTYTISARLYFTAAPTGALGRAPGILYWYSTNGSVWNEAFGPKAPTTPGTYTVSHTVTVPSNATGVLIALGAASSTASQNFYYDSFMVEEGSTAHTYGDGASTNWAWLGTPHASASTGPAL